MNTTPRPKKPDESDWEYRRALKEGETLWALTLFVVLVIALVVIERLVYLISGIDILGTLNRLASN